MRAWRNGRRAGLRNQWNSVQVQVLSPAPKKGAVSNAKIKAFEAVLFSAFSTKKKKIPLGDKKEYG